MKKPSRVLILLLASLAAWLPACLPRPAGAPARPWRYADLRALFPAGPAGPSQDLIAVYTRLSGPDLQIRLDLLDLPLEPDTDLYLALDLVPGGTDALPLDALAGQQSDLLIALPASAPPQVFTPIPPGSPAGSGWQPSTGLIPRLQRDPWLDTLVVSLNRASLPLSNAGFRLQAFVVPAGNDRPSDSSDPLHSSAASPGRAPLLLAFWNILPAYTPAQALRRWDGAHTGPFGARHGLHPLLLAVRRARLPVALLDLKTPAALSALDDLGGLNMVQDLARAGLLILPDALPGSPALAPNPQALPAWALRRAALESRQTALDFGLPGSPILYTPSPQLALELFHPNAGRASSGEGRSARYNLLLTPLPNQQATARPLRWEDRLLLPLPSTSEDPQATADGLSLAARSALLANALAPAPAPLLVLGGDLPASPWGDPRAAETTLRYIAAHPWIAPLDGPGLLSALPGLAGSRSAQESFGFSAQDLPPLVGDRGAPSVPLFSTSAGDPQASVPASWIVQLESGLDAGSASDPPGTAAWQAYRALFAPLPPEPAALPALRASYAGQVGVFLEAARWASAPALQSGCQVDANQDGQAECILASEQVFSIYDPAGGRLLALFVRAPDGLHQVVAPSSQLVVGLGDASTWDPAAGDAAEPAGMHGAFSDQPPPWPVYTAEPAPDGLTFTDPGSGLSKTYSLLQDGLHIQYHLPGGPLTVQLPLALDPRSRFSPAWSERYRGEFTPQGWTWSLSGGPQVEIHTSASLDPITFNDARAQRQIAEDPNFPYPPGHYLPYPLAVLQFEAGGDFIVEIRVTDE